MSDTKVVAVEYDGIGSTPNFVVISNGKYLHVPIRAGINFIEEIVHKEEIKKIKV
tara:strand:+ start:279 stop:443 length:165 start_codon:yes stop_codon:yes gene_type:complete